MLSIASGPKFCGVGMVNAHILIHESCSGKLVGWVYWGLTPL